MIVADTARGARGLLRAQSLVPLAVEAVPAGQQPGAEAGPGFSLTAPRRVFSATALAIWTRQLAGLVGSGLTLERAGYRVIAEANQGGAMPSSTRISPVTKSARTR